MRSPARLLLVSIALVASSVVGTRAADAPAAASPRPFTALKLGTLRGLALDRADNLYIPDPKTAILYRITPDGTTTTLPTKPIKDLFAVTVAPNGTIYAVESIYALAHRLDENGATPLAPEGSTDLFLGPTALACDATGNLYISENDANLVRKVTPSGEISIYAGAFKQAGSQDGPAAAARFNRPRALAIDPAGNINIGDEADFTIRKISTDGNVTTIAGKIGETGSQDGKGPAARFAGPRGLTSDQAGNIYITDTPNHTIRKMTPDGTVTTIAGKPGEPGFVDGAAADARFNNPRAAAFDSAGNLYIADGNNAAVRMISPDGKVTTVAGASPTPPAAPHHRVIVSTDIGGTDFDDFQSMAHLFLYADSLDIEGLLSSPYGGGRKAQILRAIDCYERDYANLKTYSDRYPTPDALRAITKQGGLDTAGYAGFDAPSEGSDWIIACVRRDDPRPLYVLIWGGIEDLAQALHDAPEILPKLRVYFIGGPNKKWSVGAYHYIATHHPQLWIIEANETHWGWFTGGNQTGDLGNTPFVAAHIAGHGALGEYFAAQLKPTLKMGDTPSVAYLLHGKPDDPSQESWGGQFVRAWERPHKVFDRFTTASDEIEQFGVFELALPIGDRAPGQPEARMQIENQSLPGSVDANGAMRFRFSPKEAKVYGYTIHANTPALDGKTGALTSVRPPPDAALRPSPLLPNWWTDDPAPAVAEGPRLGAKTISRWREEFLRDFATRMLCCKSPAPKKSDPNP